jgi:hypothetical protein
MRGAFERAARNSLFSLINRIAPAKRRLVGNLSGLSRKDLARLPPSPRGTRRLAPFTNACVARALW